MPHRPRAAPGVWRPISLAVLAAVLLNLVGPRVARSTVQESNLGAPLPGWKLARLLEAEELPAVVTGAAAGLLILAHDSPGLAMAFYQPAVTLGEESVPRRLFLRSDVYWQPAESATGSNGRTLRAPSTLAVDAYEYLTHALLLAASDGPVPSSWQEVAAERARELFPEASEESRVVWYLSVTTEFGSHVLSLHHQIKRAFERRRARGRPMEGLCAQRDPARGLFSLWEVALGDGEFRGYALPRRPAPAIDGADAAATASGEEVFEAPPPGFEATRLRLPQQDKKLYLERYLDRRWVGDATTDFASLCGGRALGGAP